MAWARTTQADSRFSLDQIQDSPIKKLDISKTFLDQTSLHVTSPQIMSAGILKKMDLDEPDHLSQDARSELSSDNEHEE